MSIWNYANTGQLKDLVAYEPGKPIEDVARERGLKPEDIIKLASNENPLGPSPKAVEAMKEGRRRSSHLPGRRLVEAAQRPGGEVWPRNGQHHHGLRQQ
jgi:histidinol-phosphate/aromatic aminotransferase/cobyric acid decarboxylase-like protein